MRRAIAGITLIAVTCAPAPAAMLELSELLINSPPGSTGGVLPDYLEVHYDGFGATPRFSVVVLNAAFGNNGKIEAIVNLTPDPTDSTVVIHEDAWSASPVFNGQRVAHPVTLDLGTQFASSRRILLLDRHVSWVVDSVIGTGLNTWDPSMTALEMIELSVNGGVLEAAPAALGAIGHTLSLSVNAGEALFRHVVDDLYADAFSRGAPDASLGLGDGQKLNPTFVNVMSSSTGGGDDDEASTQSPPASHMPEPSGAALFAVVTAALAAARRSTGRRRS